MEKDEATEIMNDMQDTYRKLRTIEEVYLNRKYVQGKYVKMDDDDEYEDPLGSGIQELIQVIDKEGVISDEDGGQEGLYAVMAGLVELFQERVWECHDKFLDLLSSESEETQEWIAYAKSKVWSGNMGVFLNQFRTSYREVEEKIEEIRERVEGGFFNPVF